jgi:hypothetical protein
MLAGCDSAADLVEPPRPVVPPQNVVLQGSITGLGTRRPVVLQYNGQDMCVETQSASMEGIPCRFFGIAGQLTSTFSFGSLPVGTAYAITVKTQPFGKICSVANAIGVLGAAAAAPAVSCVNDPAVPRHAVTVHIAPDVAQIPGARVMLRTEEGVQERPAFGATSITFADALFDSQISLPVFKWFVTATSTEGGTINHCKVAGGTNENFDAAGQDTTVPPSGPVDNVQVTSCSFAVTAAVAYQAAAGQPALPMPPDGMELALRRSRTGVNERTVQVEDFSTVSFADVSSNADAI